MNTFKMKSTTMLALMLAATLATSPAMAEKPSWAGGGKADKGDSKGRDDRGDGKGREDRGDGKGRDERSERGGKRIAHFEERHRVALREYYGERFRAGRCPPGLAKKHNGCLPPGQARKWQIGYRLPSDVIYYNVPQQLVVQFGQPPSGYRYVRVASDILLMAIGTGMIVDAIQDLGGN